MRVTRKTGHLRVRRKQEEFSPMEGVGNMADAMLVFACGILIMLIMSWNVDVTDTGKIQQSEKYEVEGINNNVTEEIGEDTNLQEMGKVYLDPDTGKYYVIEE